MKTKRFVVSRWKYIVCSQWTCSGCSPSLVQHWGSSSGCFLVEDLSSVTDWLEAAVDTSPVCGAAELIGRNKPRPEAIARGLVAWLWRTKLCLAENGRLVKWSRFLSDSNDSSSEFWPRSSQLGPRSVSKPPGSGSGSCLTHNEQRRTQSIRSGSRIFRTSCQDSGLNTSWFQVELSPCSSFIIK